MPTGITKQQLMAKARGFTVSIEKMNDKQRSDRPTMDYGNDYNKLRTKTAELYPELVELLPPPVGTFRTEYGGGGTYQSYGEIDTYCEQIFQLLSEQD